jgi:DNA-binding transcriptional MerR regulator
MTTEEILIHELAARAGISVRTIRYYIEEGLLPQPTYQGKYSYYTLNYLDRLELIRRLKDSYLPLREIREIMSSLTDADVQEKLKQQPGSSQSILEPPMRAQPSGKPGEEALRYINQLMDDQTRYKSKGTDNKTQPIFIGHTQESAQSRPSSPEISSGSLEEEIWQRIALAPGVELHLRQPLDPDTNSRVWQVIQYAKRMFSIKSQGGTK